ncbi:hypothetical protein SASPL_155756 [Salvia splendens]|uniref:Uncharacterized protein n=1 Tax=Salvia splendens TaxID=180675 RepID=A0A8X8VXY3_SALSN|nr:hypothetical protein SASPL_155756 [Salvia splendens]
MVREAVERGETERSGAFEVVQGGGGDGNAICDWMRGEWGLDGIVNPLVFELEEGLELLGWGDRRCSIVRREMWRRICRRWRRRRLGAIGII